MLAIAAAKKLHPGAPGMPRPNAIAHVGKASYQTSSSHGRPLQGKSKWFSRFLDYLRSGASKAAASAAKPGFSFAGRTFSKTAAERLRMAMPRGPAWLSRLAQCAPTSIKGAAMRMNGSTYVRFLSQRLSKQLLGWPGVARFVTQRTDAGRLAFGGGGKWAPYMKQFMSSLRGLSVQANSAPARTIMAQIQRQAMACTITQERRELSTLSPLFGETRIRLLNAAEAGKDGPTSTALGKLYNRQRSAEKEGKGSTNAVTGKNSSKDPNNANNQDMHPIAKAAQMAAVPMEQCVTITVPYTLAVPNHLAGIQNASIEDVSKALADLQQAQQRHSLLLSRLLERLSAASWNIQYRQVDRPVESIQIGLPPSTGITTARACEVLLCDWGFDIALFAATISSPLKPQSEQLAADRYANAKAGASNNISNSKTSLSGSEDIDSRLFSLIVDEVVDPDEAYREEVRDFLELLEQMPQLSRVNKKASYSKLVGSTLSSSITTTSALYV
ncbi:hypothetical protein BX070DRAFT_222585 [Coemansia spiralis]|nr:hypothetical protein BX070DRAFT_222585 [Coemansia spiralis]